MREAASGRGSSATASTRAATTSDPRLATTALLTALVRTRRHLLPGVEQTWESRGALRRHGASCASSWPSFGLGERERLWRAAARTARARRSVRSRRSRAPSGSAAPDPRRRGRWRRRSPAGIQPAARQRRPDAACRAPVAAAGSAAWPQDQARATTGTTSSCRADQVRAAARDLRRRCAHRRTVLERWGFDRQLSLRQGRQRRCSPARPAPARRWPPRSSPRELGLDLYKIDLSRVVSKYIGETEKNLDRIFARRRATPTRSCSSTRPTRCSASAPRSRTRTTATPTSRSPTCCSRWRSTTASPSWRPTCARTSTRPSSAACTSSIEFPFPDEPDRAAHLAQALPARGAARRRRRPRRSWPASSSSPAATSATSPCAAAFLAAEDGGAIGMAPCRPRRQARVPEARQAGHRVRLRPIPAAHTRRVIAQPRLTL